MNENKLTKKEEDFCRWYARLGSLKEAAERAGFTAPEYRGLCLLMKKSVKQRISQLSEEAVKAEALAVTGLKRLAFGSTADAVRLILACDGESKIDPSQLDLFAVSEIKYTCGKGMEIKFFDRIKALERLYDYAGGDGGEGAKSFYEALERSAVQGEQGDG